MNLNFAVVLAALGADAAFRIANAARSGAEYLFASLLPEQPRFDYTAESGSMTVRATMAGMVGMDSPYPPGGIVEASSFLEKTVKIANHIRLNEASLRQLQTMMLQLQLAGTPTTERVQQEVLNFLNKVVIQPHLDTAEWMRARALFSGKLQWTFNKITLDVDYGVPAGNILTRRTGNDSWDGSTSKFWDDIRLLRKALKNNVRAFVLHEDTLEAVRYNTANGMVVTAESGSGAIRTVTFQRYARDSAGAFDPRQFSQDSTERATFIAYSAEAEVIDPADPATPVVVPFVPTGRILAVGNNTSTGFVVGQGSTEDPNESNRLGYTHLAPTVEAGGVPGRWADLFTPEFEPWSLHGRAVTNLLPVIEAPDKIAIASSDLT